MTNKQIAINLINGYVLNQGETVADLNKGKLGHYNQDYKAHIDKYKIFVKQKGQEEEVFSLQKIYNEIIKSA